MSEPAWKPVRAAAWDGLCTTFEGENIQTQNSVLGYRIDLYFHKYKLAIEVDELGNAERNIYNEIERQKALEKD